MKKNLERNYGLELLRMILCFWVVLFHTLKITKFSFIINFKRKMFHVPTFFFISFYFLFPVINGRNVEKRKLRLQRLLIPYFIWPLITWNLNNIIFFIFNKSRFGRLLTSYELILQLIFGRLFFVQFWFLFNLLLFTIIFFILSIIFEINNFLMITKLLAILSYFLQYSKYNYIFFDNYPDCISHSVGHFVETLPLAATAFILYFSGILNGLRKTRYSNIFYCSLVIYFIYNYKIFISIEKYGRAYNYNGVDKNVFSIFSFIGFYLLPFEISRSKNLKNIIKIVSNYTQGIYSIHIIIQFYIKYFFNLKGTFQVSIINYIISYLISFIGAKLCFNTKLKFLFI